MDEIVTQQAVLTDWVEHDAQAVVGIVVVGEENPDAILNFPAPLTEALEMPAVEAVAMLWRIPDDMAGGGCILTEAEYRDWQSRPDDFSPEVLAMFQHVVAEDWMFG